MVYKPYWNYKIKEGDFIDPKQRFIYLRDAEPSKSGYRRAVVREIETGDVFEASFTALRTDIAKSPTEKAANMREAGKRKSLYHEGDIIGKYGNILILNLDPDKYPPLNKGKGKTARCGLFRNMVTGEEFVSTLDGAMQKSADPVCSRGEAKIQDILKKMGIKFETQRGFKGLVGFTGGRSLRFDFYLPDDDVIIEYDGDQHLLSSFDYSIYGGTPENRFSYYARDIMKESWCAAHRISIIRIASVPPDEIDEILIAKLISDAKKSASQDSYLTIYPPEKEAEYESVAVTMSNLDGRYQYDFYRAMRDTCIDYRRPNDKSIDEDEALRKALPHGSAHPVLYTEPLPRSFYRKKRIPYVIGDEVGRNGVRYMGDFDEDGNKIESSSGKRRALFECPCGNTFVSSFSSVKGCEKYNYDGKLCPECAKERRAQKLREAAKNRDPRPVKTYIPGEKVDPEGKFSFVEEIPSEGNARTVLVEDNEGNRYEFKLASLLHGTTKTIREKAEAKEKRAHRRINKGDVIGVDGTLIAEQDLDYHTYDDYSKIRILVTSTKSKKTYEVSLYTALFTVTDGTRGRITHKAGEIVGDAGVAFIEWCDEHGEAIEEVIGGISEYARFRCSCDEHTEFVAEWARVRDGRKQCPACMQKREEEGRRKNGLARKLTFEIGVDTVDPDGKYVYMGEDEDATTKKRKIIIKSTETGETFSYQFDKVRQGTIIPPSQAKKGKAKGREANKKYSVGDIISSKRGEFCIVGETEPVINSAGDAVRSFIFQNLTTGYLFESVVQPVRNGVVTGARSKKTRDDFPSIPLLSESEVKQAVKNGAEPSRKRKSEAEIVAETGEEKIQAMLNAGMSSSQIGNELGVAFQSVCRFIKKHGLSNPNTNEGRKVDVSKMPLDEIERRLDSGQSMTSIGKELGYTHAWMKKAVEELDRRKGNGQS